jgi:hypothetical protein
MIDRRRKISAEIQKDALEIVGLAHGGSILACQDKVELILYARSIGVNSVSKIAAAINADPSAISQLLKRGNVELAKVKTADDETAKTLFVRAWNKYRAKAQIQDIEKFDRSVEESKDWRAHAASLKMKYPEDFNFDPSDPKKANSTTIFNVKEIRVQQIQQMSTPELIEFIDKVKGYLPQKDEIQEATIVDG